jgi:hypothetical protein
VSKYRQAARVDSTQSEVVKQLRSIPGVTVSIGHDDFLIGRNGLTYWVEWKAPCAVKKSGELRSTALKPSQKKLLNEWEGHYLVAWSLEQILQEIGVIHGNNI